MAEIAKGEWEQRGGEGKVLSFRDQLVLGGCQRKERKSRSRYKLNRMAACPGTKQRFFQKEDMTNHGGMQRELWPDHMQVISKFWAL